MKVPNEYLKEKITQNLHMHYYTHLEEEKNRFFSVKSGENSAKSRNMCKCANRSRTTIIIGIDKSGRAQKKQKLRESCERVAGQHRHRCATATWRHSPRSRLLELSHFLVSEKTTEHELRPLSNPKTLLDPISQF